jgi:hypothetical protein
MGEMHDTYGLDENGEYNPFDGEDDPTCNDCGGIAGEEDCLHYDQHGPVYQCDDCREKARQAKRLAKGIVRQSK